MKRLIAIFLLIGCTTVSAADKFFVSGNQMHEWCNNEIALPYILGVVDGIGFMNQVYPETAKLCIPDRVARGQIGDIACKFLSDHPEKRHYTGDQVVFLSLIEAFPCS